MSRGGNSGMFRLGLLVTCGLLVLSACTEISSPSPSPAPQPAPDETPVQPSPEPQPEARPRCDPSYPSVCIPPYPPDLDCGEIAHRRFRVTGSDPHGFDRDRDGIGCESG